MHRTIQDYLTAQEIAEEDHIGALLDVAHLDLFQQVVIMTVAIQTSRCGLSSSLTWSTVRTGNVDTAERSPCSPPPAWNPLHRFRLSNATGSKTNSARYCRQAESSRRAHSRPLGDFVLRWLLLDLSSLSAAAAATTIRTAALINWPGALTLLAGYATDPRPRVRACPCLQYFDPHEYAQRVRADPLDGGRLHVTHARPFRVPHPSRGT